MEIKDRLEYVKSQIRYKYKSRVDECDEIAQHVVIKTLNSNITYYKSFLSTTLRNYIFDLGNKPKGMFVEWGEEYTNTDDWDKSSSFKVDEEYEDRLGFVLENASDLLIDHYLNKIPYKKLSIKYSKGISALKMALKREKIKLHNQYLLNN